jgi:transcription termination/antitermination protein NusG
MIGEALPQSNANPKLVKKWYALYTHAKWEKKVASVFTKKNIENYCPLNRVLRQWSDRKKIVYEPLFTCYVFARVNEKERISVLQTEGVLNYVSWQGKPAVIRDSEIEAIKNFLIGHSNVKLEKLQIGINDKVRITHGVFMEQEGIVMEVLGKTVRVGLPSLGYVLTAEISKSHVEVVSNSAGETY